VLCKAAGEDVVGRWEKNNSGFKCEDLVELCWCFCVLESYHQELFQLTFKAVHDTPKLPADCLCQLYEVHLVLQTERKESYDDYRIEDSAVTALLDHYKENRKDARRCSDKTRSDVTSSVKSLLDCTVHANHRTSFGLLADVAALRKKSSTEGYVHVEIDGALSFVRPIDQEESTAGVLDGAVALRRRIMEKKGLKLATVAESKWKTFEESKEKRKHLKSLMKELDGVLD